MSHVKEICAAHNYACAIERQRRRGVRTVTIFLVCGVLLTLAIVGRWLSGLWTA